MAIRRRNLTAHNELLVKVIKDQAGALDKGILEGVMNGREAGSEQVRIITQSDGKKLIIEDDGKGFRSETEISEWFEKFGTPHADSEGKKWARFRMGRGQLFAFGKNIWRTGGFRMVVVRIKTELDNDVNFMGLEFRDYCGADSPAFVDFGDPEAIDLDDDSLDGGFAIISAKFQGYEFDETSMRPVMQMIMAGDVGQHNGRVYWYGYDKHGGVGSRAETYSLYEKDIREIKEVLTA